MSSTGTSHDYPLCAPNNADSLIPPFSLAHLDQLLQNHPDNEAVQNLVANVKAQVGAQKPGGAPLTAILNVSASPTAGVAWSLSLTKNLTGTSGPSGTSFMGSGIFYGAITDDVANLAGSGSWQLTISNNGSTAKLELTDTNGVVHPFTGNGSSSSLPATSQGNWSSN